MIVIGIAGGTGSGKTTVARRILERFPGERVALISQDSYYNRAPAGKSIDELRKMNYDHPDAFDWDLLCAHLAELRGGRAVDMPTYSVLTCDRLPETVRVEPCDVLVVEGILVLYKKKLRDLLDLKIYVDADPDERLIRVIERDVEERGRTARVVMNRYRRVLKPMHREFIEPTKEQADLIVPQGGENHKAIEILQGYIGRMLEATAADNG